jgi:hypothetical protein
LIESRASVASYPSRSASARSPPGAELDEEEDEDEDDGEDDDDGEG